MQRLLRTAKTTSILGMMTLSFSTLSACTNPRQFGRSSTTPVPSAIGGGPGLASRAPATLRMIRPAPPAPPPLYPDETQAGAPWSGLQLSTQPSAQGIFVGLVSMNSPAETAGVQAGDFIFQLDGHLVSDAREVMSEISRVGVGGSLRLGVHRGERVRLFRVEPMAKPAPVQVAASESTAVPLAPSAALEQPAPPAPSN